MTNIKKLLEHWGTDELDHHAENVLKDWDKIDWKYEDGHLEEARELLQIMAHRERQYKELLNRKHPAYDIAMLNWYRDKSGSPDGDGWFQLTSGGNGRKFENTHILKCVEILGDEGWIPCNWAGDYQNRTFVQVVLQRERLK